MTIARVLAAGLLAAAVLLPAGRSHAQNLTVAEVQQVIAGAAVEANARGRLATIAVVDRVGNVLGVFDMNAGLTQLTVTTNKSIPVGNGLEQVQQTFTGAGAVNSPSTRVVVASTNASLFAYVADGANGLRVLQLTSPDSQPRFYGFSPDPVPELIATRKTAHRALSLSKGLDRDRAVDETGHQIAVFGRLGSRPFNLEEMKRLYLDKDGKPWYVTDDVLPNGAAAGTTPKGR